MNADTISLAKGDRAPWFRAPALAGSPTYAFDTVAGRHVLMLFFGSAGLEPSSKALAIVQRNRELFDDRRACFFGITTDCEDAAQRRIAPQLPGIRFFVDDERRISRLYGATSGSEYRPYWLVLDPGLRVAQVFPIDEGENAVRFLRSALQTGQEGDWAPVLLVPDVLEPELCQRMIDAFEARGGIESGFMREVDGKTTMIMDRRHKQRRDCTIEDEELKGLILASLTRRLIPEVKFAFQFEATRVERHIVACYAAGAGHFRPHRDNRTSATSHRKFAVTINLNAGAYEGGDLRFPEFGQRSYRAPTGGAIAFSCSLLHEATPVVTGRRYAYLPFLYDEEGARIRQANNARLDDSVRPYLSDPVSNRPRA